MTITEERAPLDRTDWLLGQLAATLDRASRLFAEAAEVLAEPRSVDLGASTGPATVVATMPVGEVPVDGSVEVRPVTGSGRFGPWVHVIGEQARAIGGCGHRTLLIDGLVEPFTWHRDMCVQVRPFRRVDEDLADARHRLETGGL